MDTHFFKKDLTNYNEACDVIGMTEYVVHLADVVAGIDYVFKKSGGDIQNKQPDKFKCV